MTKLPLTAETFVPSPKRRVQDIHQNNVDQTNYPQRSLHLDAGPEEHDDDAKDGRDEGVKPGPVLHARLIAGFWIPVVGRRSVDEGRQRPDLWVNSKGLMGGRFDMIEVDKLIKPRTTSNCFAGSQADSKLPKPPTQ